jgi:hypothetical protein
LYSLSTFLDNFKISANRQLQRKDIPIALVGYLSNNAVDINSQFLQAVTANDTGAVIKLIQEGKVKASARDNKAIKFASERGFGDIVVALLQERCVDPSSDENIALQNVASNGHAKILQALLHDDRYVIITQNRSLK